MLPRFRFNCTVFSRQRFFFLSIFQLKNITLTMTVTSEIQKTRIWYKFNVISQAIEKKKNRRKIDQKSPTANFPIQQCKRSILGSTSFKVFTIEWHFESMVDRGILRERVSSSRVFHSYRKGDAADRLVYDHYAFLLRLCSPTAQKLLQGALWHKSPVFSYFPALPLD